MKNVTVAITEDEAKVLKLYLERTMTATIGFSNPTVIDRLLLKLFKAYQAQNAQ